MSRTENELKPLMPDKKAREILRLADVDISQLQRFGEIQSSLAAIQDFLEWARAKKGIRLQSKSVYHSPHGDSWDNLSDSEIMSMAYEFYGLDPVKLKTDAYDAIFALLQAGGETE